MSEIIKELRFYSGDRNLNNNQATFSSNQIGALAENIFLKDGTVLEDSLGDINFMEKGSLMSQINNIQQVISTQIESSGNRFIKQTGGQVHGNLLFKNLDGTTPAGSSIYMGPNGLRTPKIIGGSTTDWQNALFFTSSSVGSEKIGSITPGQSSAGNKFLAYNAINQHLFRVGEAGYSGTDLNSNPPKKIVAVIDTNGMSLNGKLTINEGPLIVKGTTTLQNTLTVSGAYTTTLGGDLKVTGATILKATTLNGALTVDGNYKTTLKGALEVTKATTLKNTLTVSGNYKTTLEGALEVTKATTLNDTLKVNGDHKTTLGGALEVAGTTTLKGTTINGTLTANGNILCGTIKPKTGTNEFILENGFQDAIIIDTLTDVVNLMKPSRKYPYHKPYPVIITRRGYIYLRTQLDVAYGGTSGVTYHGGNIVENKFVNKYGSKQNITIGGVKYTPKEAVKLEAVNQYILGHFVKVQNAVAGGQDGVAVIFGIGQKNGLPHTIRYRFTYDKSEKVTVRKYFIISGSTGEELKSATLK